MIVKVSKLLEINIKKLRRLPDFTGVFCLNAQFYIFRNVFWTDGQMRISTDNSRYAMNGSPGEYEDALPAALRQMQGSHSFGYHILHLNSHTVPDCSAVLCLSTELLYTVPKLLSKFLYILRISSCKRGGSLDEYFFKAYQHSIFCTCADGFKFFRLPCFFENSYRTNSKDCSDSEARIKMFVPAFLGRYRLSRLSEQFLVTGGYLKVGTSYLK
jgi:hypothetical protein